MTLDDLGRAVWEAKWKEMFGEFLSYDLLHEHQRETQIHVAVAAVKVFAEAYCAQQCRRCREGKPVSGHQGMWWHEDPCYECHAGRMRNFLSSLLDEAGECTAERK